jgi:hypothetical protein
VSTNTPVRITRRGWIVITLAIITNAIIVNAVLANWTWYGGFQ